MAPAFKLYYDTRQKPLDLPCNRGFDRAMQLLKKMKVSFEIVDTSQLPDDELYNAYSDACTPSVYRKFRIRQIFGSRRHSGWLFGKGVPALLVYEGSQEYPVDVYPHEERGRIITIREYVEKLLS